MTSRQMSRGKPLQETSRGGTPSRDVHWRATGARDAGERADATRAVRPATTGLVVRGDGRGRAIGFPTANLAAPCGGIRDGVYAALVAIDGEQRLRAALANVGPSPTFAIAARRLEVHLLDFEGDLYGRRLRVELLARLAGQRRCTSPAALTLRIRRLAARARSALAAASPLQRTEPLPRSAGWRENPPDDR